MARWQRQRPAKVHAPVAAGDCLFCHAPHQAERGGLLRGDAEALCVPCHQDVREQAKLASVHAPFRNFACGECHQPHRGGAGLLRQPDPALSSAVTPRCRRRSKTVVPHPPALEACGTCHSSHAAKEHALLKQEGSGVCLTCHSDVEEQLKQPFVHEPIAAGACAACHDPHGGARKGLLAQAQPRLCLDCHRREDEQRAMKAQHPPFAAGTCTASMGRMPGRARSCSSKSSRRCARRAMRRPSRRSLPSPSTPRSARASAAPATTRTLPRAPKGLLQKQGADLCFSCHTNLRDSVAVGVVHAPVRNRRCMTCHDAHATKGSDGRVAVKAACTTCHDLADAKLKQAHKEFDMTANSCTSCHDPHRSAKKGLLRAVAHPPFAEGACATCHKPPAPGAKPELVASQSEVCAACHGPIEKPAAPKGLRAQVEAGECSTCHTAHAGRKQALLVDDLGTLCKTCHTDVAPAEADPAQVHRPVRDGECRKCHGGHQGIMPGLLEKSPPALCAECHADLAKRTQGAHPHARPSRGSAWSATNRTSRRGAVSSRTMRRPFAPAATT